jgi:hypothetical protein
MPFMPTVEVVSKVNIELDEVLDSVAQLEIAELGQFAFQVNSVLARRKAPSLPEQEAELLQRINQGVAPTALQRYDELNAKRQDETLTPEEHQELLALITRIEEADAERLKHLVELAQLRGVSLDALMDQLGIHPPTYA